MDDMIGPENGEEAAARRIREAQEQLDKPKIDALKRELGELKKTLDPERVYGPESFVRQFQDALVRAENFSKALFPPPLP